jgi:PPOX class probable F420-dependent enzyme
MNAPIEALADWARALLETSPVARLGLLDDHDDPRVLPITFVVWKGAIWSAIDRKPKRDPAREPARLRYLRRRPGVALTVDRYETDWEALAWVQVLGTAAIIDAAEAAEAMAALARKYEQYRAEPPPGPLIRIEPARTLSWRASPEAEKR